MGGEKIKHKDQLSLASTEVEAKLGNIACLQFYRLVTCRLYSMVAAVTAQQCRAARLGCFYVTAILC